MLGPADVTAPTHLDIEHADLAHPLQVGADRVRMQIERVGDVGGREGPRRTRQLQVDGVARVVTERLQHIELGGVRCGRVDVHLKRLHGVCR